MTGNLISIDIGSTYTKGALFVLEGGRLRLAARKSTPTTLQDLALGFATVLCYLQLQGQAPVYASSSAKGGLRIAAVGLVPDLTLHAARQVVQSAGGKVVARYAYGLTEQDLKTLSELRPDIVLLTGGTDGGHSRTVLANAEALAGAGLSSTVLYAGNSAIASRVEAILERSPHVIVPNVLPDLDTVHIEPARQAVRDIFLSTIVEGRGLSSVEAQLAAPLRPTPLSLFRLLEEMERRGLWQDTLVLDLGGATTDVYSLLSGGDAGSDVVLRGLVEPYLKRSVEGDLGMRVSAVAAVAQSKDDRLQAWAERVQADHAAAGPADRDLARVCLYQALRRHAGRLTRVYTPTGKVPVQRGKDLQRIRQVIGTGGYFSAHPDPALLADLFTSPETDGEASVLCPLTARPAFDQDYVLPLLGNLVDACPEETIVFAQDCLEQGDGPCHLTRHS